MTQRRDDFQRKAFAARRMILAMDRQAHATSVDEKGLASRWAALWSAIAGFRHFPLEKPGRAVYKKRRVTSPRRKSLSTW